MLYYPNMITYREAAKQFLDQATSRRNNPLAANSAKTYKSQIETHQNPAFGDHVMELVDNDEVKKFIDNLHKRKVAAATIRLNFTIIKKIRASVKNPDRSTRFPIIWDMEYLDLPSDPSETITVSAQTVQGAINQLGTPEEALVAVLAGSGLRIGEAMAITGGYDDGACNFWDGESITVRGQRQGNKIGPTKTEAGVRVVDLAPELNLFLKTKLPGLTGFMFPKSATHYTKKLREVGIVGGFHSLRRFRTTHLNKSNCPTGLEYFWMGHAAKDVHGGYVQFGKEIEARKTEAARIGLGFKLETT